MAVKLSVELCGRLADACGRVVTVELPQGETPLAEPALARGPNRCRHADVYEKRGIPEMCLARSNP